MTVSALAIGVHRVLIAESVVALLGKGGDDQAPSVFPIQIPKGAPVPAITVNRLFERVEDGTTSIVLALTCMADSVQRLEAVGTALIDALDGSSFDFAGLVDITFEKSGSDVTGVDPDRGYMLRQIEFLVGY